MSEAKVMPEDYIDFLIVSSVHFTATEAAKVQPDYPDPPADDAFTRLLHRLVPASAVLWTEAQTQVQLTDVVLVRAFPFLVLAGVVGVGIPGNLIFPCREVSMVTLTLLGRSPPCPILAARTVASTRSRQSSVWSPWPCSWGEKA